MIQQYIILCIMQDVISIKYLDNICIGLYVSGGYIVS